MLRLVSLFSLTLVLASRVHAQDDEGAFGLATPPRVTARLLVLPAVGRGIDPVVAPHVTNQLRETGAALGYELVLEADARAALERLRLREAAAPADLWRATYVAQARRGVSTQIWAERGRYVFEILVASLDGTGPFRARGDASADELLARVDAELRRILAPSAEWNADEAARLAAGASPSQPARPFPPPGAFPTSRPMPLGARRAPRFTDRPWSLAIQTEAAIGTTGDGFYNHLIGARLDYHFSRSFALGVYLGYANLRGNGGRVSNLLPYVQLEHRVHLIGVDGLSVPIRAGVGFLPYNGVFVRVAGGLNLPVTDRIELGADLITPTFWFTPDGRATSFDVALEVIYRFGERTARDAVATPRPSAAPPAR